MTFMLVTWKLQVESDDPGGGEILIEAIPGACTSPTIAVAVMMAVAERIGFAVFVAFTVFVGIGVRVGSGVFVGVEVDVDVCVGVIVTVGVAVCGASPSKFNAVAVGTGSSNPSVIVFAFSSASEEPIPKSWSASPMIERRKAASTLFDRSPL